MLLPLIAALVYLVLSSRILVDAKLQVHGMRLHAGIALRAWGVRLILDITPKGSFSRERAGTRIGQIRRYGDLMLAGVRTIRWGQIDLHACIGTGDAAQTAVASGVLYALISSLLASVGRMAQSDVRIVPDFGARRLNAHARCIFSVAPGDIMFAVAKEAVKKTQREGLSWLSTPLRA